MIGKSVVPYMADMIINEPKNEEEKIFPRF
jgi:hypothetical protein